VAKCTQTYEHVRCDWLVLEVRHMKASVRLVFAILLSVTIGTVWPSEPAVIGSAAFRPSPDHPIGWRGDGSGIYPGATPPATWSYAYNNLVSELSMQAKKPGAERSGVPVEGMRPLTEWLILGPFPVADTKEGMDKSFVGDETTAQADIGQKAGTNEWRQWEIFPGNQSDQYRGGNIDLGAAFGKLTNQAVYAQTNLWSPRDGQVEFRLVAPHALKMWINGKLVTTKEATPNAVEYHIPADLLKGWNRVLVKSVAGAKWSDYEGWKVFIQAWPTPAELQAGKVAMLEKNVPWMTAMPGGGLSLPVVVGDNIYVSADPFYLLCMSKKDGKILWMKHFSQFDTVDEIKAEDKAQATNEGAVEAKAKAKTLLSQLDEINSKLISQISNNSVVPHAVAADANLVNQKTAIEKQLFQLVGAAYPKDFSIMAGLSEQKWSVATPCSDGEYIYVFNLMNAVAACYKLDGTLRWMHKEPVPRYHEHGYCSSPVLVGGKFVVHADKLKAFDCATGALAWAADTQGAYASLMVSKSTGSELILTGNSLALFRPSDGKRMSPELPQHGAISTPIIVDNTVFVFFGDSSNYYRVEQWRLPAHDGGTLELMKSIPLNKKLPEPTQNKIGIGGWRSPCSSPVYHEGLVYFVSEVGTLHVIDVAKGEMVYERWLDLQPSQFYVGAPGVCASLAIAGKYLYVMGDTYVTLVIAPGREYKQVSKNTLAVGDMSLSTPIFDGSRMYYHSPSWLMCIGEH